MGENGMAMEEEGFVQKLAEVSKPNYGDFELVRAAKISGKFGFVVVELGGVQGLDSQGLVSPPPPEKEQGRGERYGEGGGEMWKKGFGYICFLKFRIFPCPNPYVPLTRAYKNSKN